MKTALVCCFYATVAPVSAAPQKAATNVIILESLPIGSPERVRTHMIALVDRVWIGICATREDFPLSGGYNAAVEAGWNISSYGATNILDSEKIVFGPGADEERWLRRGKDAAIAYLSKVADGQFASYDLKSGARLPPDKTPSFEKPTTVLIKYRPIGILSYTHWYPKTNLPTVVEVTDRPFLVPKLERSIDLRTWSEVIESETVEHLHDDAGWDRFSFQNPLKQPTQFFRAVSR